MTLLPVLLLASCGLGVFLILAGQRDPLKRRINDRLDAIRDDSLDDPAEMPHLGTHLSGWDGVLFGTIQQEARLVEGTIGPAATYMAWQTDHEGIANHLSILESHGVGTASGSAAGSVLTLYAQYVAELMVETLRIAGQALTREGLVDAAESITDWTCSVCLFPVTLGPDDHDPAQAAAIAQFRGGRIEITDEAYSWEGVAVADLSVDTLTPIEVPADALP